MKSWIMKLNLGLVFGSVVILYVIFCFDGKSLNSLVVDDDYVDDFVTFEVNVLDEENNNVVMVNNNDGVDNWVFPVYGDYLITTYYSYSHKAIDIYSYSGYGSNIVSAFSGTVIEVSSSCASFDLSCNGRRGNYVVIEHNRDNYYTVYMHLKDVYVSVGDSVNGGDLIGTMGNTGYVIPAPSSDNPYGGTHLHFCVFVGRPYYGGYAIDPLELY